MVGNILAAASISRVLNRLSNKYYKIFFQSKLKTVLFSELVVDTSKAPISPQITATSSKVSALIQMPTNTISAIGNYFTLPMFSNIFDL